MAWLSNLNFASRQADFLKRQQPGTGEWLLSDPVFQSWLKGNNRTLWCPGLRKSPHRTQATSWC
jgi:hypothetical protein